MRSKRVLLVIVFLVAMALVAIAMPTARVQAANTSLANQIGSAGAACDGPDEPAGLVVLRAFYAKCAADLVSSTKAAWDGATEPTSLAMLRAFYAKDEEVSGWSLPVRTTPGQGPY